MQNNSNKNNQISSRYNLYKFAFDYLERDIHNSSIANIREHFNIAMIILNNLEYNVFSENSENFLLKFRNNVAELKYNETFILNYKKEIYDILDPYGPSANKSKEPKELLRDIIKTIADVHNKKIIIDDNFLNGSDYYLKKQNNNQVFLSYAYDDKGLTYALYLYFKAHNIFLFVDWMQNGKSNNCIYLKNFLKDMVRNSRQLLLLRTPNSEYKTKGNRQIRQWCSWECGIGFDEIPDEKYILNFSSGISEKNFFIDDFKEMQGIDTVSGMIY